MLIHRFMENYKKAWETSNEFLLASLFTEDGRYHNTPFSVQAGHAQIKQYWQRTRLQADIALSFEVLHASALSGIAHWHTTYQVTSEEMFAMWAASTGTTQLARKPDFLGSEPKFSQPKADPSGATHGVAEKLVSDPNKSRWRGRGRV